MAVDPLTLTGGINAGLSLIDSLVRTGRINEARNILQNMNIPPADKMAYEAVLVNDPERFSAMVQGRTEMEQITEDPRLRAAQMEGVEGLGDIVAAGGYTPVERAQMERVSNEMLTRQKGARQAALQQAQARGLGGSGLRLASDIGMGQAALGAASQRGFDIAAGGQQRALQAMQARAGLGGQIRGQDWGQAAEAARSQDVINRANRAAQNQMTQQYAQQKWQGQLANQQAQMDAAKSKADAEKIRADMLRQQQQALASTYMG